MNRYESLDRVKELGEQAADIRKKTVTVLGLGALGSTVAELLARAGVNLRIIDKDRVLEQDIPLLSLYTMEHCSKFKAKEAKKLLENINPDIKVKAFHEELMQNNAYLVEADAIIDCSNNFETSLLANEARKKTPIIYVRAGGVEGCALILDETGVDAVKDFLEKHVSEYEEQGTLPSTIHLTASLAVNKTLKLLSGQRYEKNLLKVNGWKFSFDKVAVRKK